MLDVDRCVGVVRCGWASASLCGFLLLFFLAVCLIEEEQQTNDPGAGALQKEAHSRTRGKLLFLHIDVGRLPSYFAHVCGVVWEFVCVASQGHPVAVRLQLHHFAAVS